ncbi:hypothetical protein FRB95_002261 [Tulasnella sp. JGI-2019a]|nr:hypothetical protein FRB95_002261 [Tulasnella sp. JGI-2019a]
MRRPRQQIDDEDMRTSLFGSVRSDSDSRPTTVTSPNLARLPPSPRKKRGARLTGNLVVDDVERRRPTDDELLYGDAPGGEYAPRGGYTSWEPTHWLDFEKPETEFYKNPLPPVNHIIRSNYASPPSLQLDREPIIITQHMCAAEPGRKSSMRADETTSKLQQSQSELGPDTATLESNGAQTQRPPPIGFRSFWQSVRQTPLGQTLETALAEEAEKEAEREVAAQIVVDSGEERSSSSAPASVASNRHLDASGSPTPPRRKPGAQTARKTNTKTLLSGVATTSTRRSASSTTPNDVNATRRIHRARKTGAKSSNRMRIISPMSERREET